jgi:predicted transcriptional regulator
MQLHQAASIRPTESEDIGAWQVRQIEEALAKAKTGGPFVPHHRVAEWARSLGTKSPLPRPAP